MTKTNAMRLLDRAGIPYEVFSYEYDESDLSGIHAAQAIGARADRVFKTLVTGGAGGFFVFCIPVSEELDLKKAAKCAGVKSLEMLHVKDLLRVTGYVRGGCSPVGMKKRYPTFIDDSALESDGIYVSAGVRGVQLRLSCAALADFVAAEFGNLTVKK